MINYTLALVLCFLHPFTPSLTLPLKARKKACWYSLGASVLAGAAKEFYDGTRKDESGPFYSWDRGKLTATSIGGLTISTTLSLFVGNINRKEKKIALVN